MKSFQNLRPINRSIVIIYLGIFAFSTLNAQIQIETLIKTDNKAVFCKMDNAIIISGPNLDLNTVKIKVNNGTFSGSAGRFYVKPSKYTPYLTIEVFSKGVSLGKEQLKILKVPDPEVCYANICGTDIKVPLGQAESPLLVKMPGFDFNEFANILSFDLTMNGRKMTAKNNYLTEDMKVSIKTGGKGAKVIFSNIKCRMPFGEKRVLASVKVTLI